MATPHKPLETSKSSVTSSIPSKILSADCYSQLLTAYNVLSDSFTRARYDEWLQAQVHDAPPMKSDDTTRNAYNAPPKEKKCGFCSNTQPKSTPPKSATPPTFAYEDDTLRYGTYHRAVKILRKRMRFVPTYTYEDLPEDYNKTRQESERAREQYEEDYSDRWDAMATKAERKTKKKDMAGDFSKRHRSGKGGRGNRRHAGSYDEW